MTDQTVAAYLSNKVYESLEVGDSFDNGRFQVKAVNNDAASGYYGAVVADRWLANSDQTPLNYGAADCMRTFIFRGTRAGILS